MIKVKLYSLCALMLMAMACSTRKIMDRQDYLAYYHSPESGFFKEKEMDGIRYKLHLQLPEFSVLNGDPDMPLQNYQHELHEHQGQVCFSLLIEDNLNANLVKRLVFDPTAYARLVEYANTELVKHISLVNGDKTIACNLVHMEPANSVQPIIRLSFGFRHLQADVKDYLVVFDDHFFNNGELRFHYAADVFKNLPNLKL